MNDETRPKREIINEIAGMRQRFYQMESSIKKFKETEKELKKEKKYLENIIESSIDPIITTDGKGYIKRFNKSFLELLACNVRDVKGKHMAELGPPEVGTYESVTGESVYIDNEFFDKIKEMAATFIKGGKITNREIYLIRKDKKIVPIEQNVVYLHNEKKDKTGAVGILREITDRKKAEKEIRETKEYLENVIESSRDGLVIVDKQGFIVSVNTAMEHMTGLEKKDLMGAHSSSLVVEDRGTRSYVLAKTKELFEKGFCSYEVKHKKADGSFLDVEFNNSLTKDNKGNVIGGLSIVRDVSERNRMEARIRKSQKIEAIGTLAGGIAHDFNNILAAIIGFSEMALQHFPAKARARSDLDQVLKAAYRGESLVEQILAFSRHSEGGNKAINLRHIINEVLKLLSATLPATIELIHNITDATVMADPTQIHQLLMNLCINAANAMREKGGVLDIKLSSVVVDLENTDMFSKLSPGNYIKLTVDDSGGGVNSEVIERIFDPFFTTRKLGEGTGMGLSVALGIAKSHGGDIVVDNKPGKGCAFHVFLPAMKEETEEATMDCEEIPAGDESILFVDDEEVLVEIGKKMLKSLGYKVTAKKSSTEALKIFKREPYGFDLVITDQTMPDLTGYDMAQQLLDIRSDIPIILCTGYSATVTQEKAKALGIKEYVKKPFNRRAIAHAVRSVLDEKKR